MATQSKQDNVVIIYNKDCVPWCEYLANILMKTCPSDVHSILDTDIIYPSSSSSSPSAAASAVAGYKVFIVIMSPGHSDCLKENTFFAYSQFVRGSSSGIVFLCGIESSELDSELQLWRQVKHSEDIDKLTDVVQELLTEEQRVVTPPPAVLPRTVTPPPSVLPRSVTPPPPVLPRTFTPPPPVLPRTVINKPVLTSRVDTTAPLRAKANQPVGNKLLSSYDIQFNPPKTNAVPQCTRRKIPPLKMVPKIARCEVSLLLCNTNTYQE